MKIVNEAEAKRFADIRELNLNDLVKDIYPERAGDENFITRASAPLLAFVWVMNNSPEKDARNTASNCLIFLLWKMFKKEPGFDPSEGSSMAPFIKGIYEHNVRIEGECHRAICENLIKKIFDMKVNFIKDGQGRIIDADKESFWGSISDYYNYFYQKIAIRKRKK